MIEYKVIVVVFEDGDGDWVVVVICGYVVVQGEKFYYFMVSFKYVVEQDGLDGGFFIVY